jgi:hypothetical protein
VIFLEPYLLKTLISTLKDTKSIKHIILNSSSKQKVSDVDLSTLKSMLTFIPLKT